MNFTFNNKTSIYKQIVAGYQRYIMAGILTKDEKLPSIRSLAYELGVNPNTIQRAYSELEKAGLIITIPKKGVFVAYQKNDNKIEEVFKNEIKRYKEAGLNKQQVLKVIEDIYGGVNNDSNK